METKRFNSTYMMLFDGFDENCGILGVFGP